MRGWVLALVFNLVGFAVAAGIVWLIPGNSPSDWMLSIALALVASVPHGIGMAELERWLERRDAR